MPALTVLAPTIASIKPACSNCGLRELCLPIGFSEREFREMDQLVDTRRSIRQGESLFHSGQAFNGLYAVRTGFFKTRISSQDGRDQVTGFHMAGDLLGLEAISAGRHACDAVALEDSRVCSVALDDLEELSRQLPGLQRKFHRIMSREIVRNHELVFMLCRMRSEERLAAFLLDLTQRLQQRGFSASELILRMSREEIGSFLGVKLETISRAFSKLQEDAILDVKGRRVRVLDSHALHRLVAPTLPSEPPHGMVHRDGSGARQSLQLR